VALVLIALDPETGGDDCPAVFIDSDTGDLVFQGFTEDRHERVAEMDTVSRMRAGESAVRLPRRMRSAILAALMEVDGDRSESDPAQ
jgi:hypothetical protein